MPAPRSEEEEDRLYEEQLTWVRAAPLVAARKAKGRHPNPMDDDPCIERLRRDLLLVEKALPRTALAAEWDSASWKEGVRACNGASDFRVSLASLESAVQDQFLSPYFYKDPLLVRGAWLPTGAKLLESYGLSSGTEALSSRKKLPNIRRPSLVQTCRSLQQRLSAFSC